MNTTELAEALKHKFNAHMGVTICVSCKTQIHDYEMYNVWNHPNGSLYAHCDLDRNDRNCSSFLFYIKKLYDADDLLSR